jgi:hypothetical protein
MLRRPRRETPIERIFREVHGHKMSAAIKRILLSNQRRKQGRIDALFLPTHDAQMEDRALQPLADGSSRAKLKEEK